MRNIFICIVGLFLLFSCSEDEEENHLAPQADFTYSDQIDKFVLTSTSDDTDYDLLSYQWSSESQLITIDNASSKMASFDIPELTESIEITIEHIVCDEFLCGTVNKSIQVPVWTEIRQWGLGRYLEASLSNNVDYEWYMDQMNTGTYSNVNCGPATVTMAIKWVDEAFEKTPEDARNTYRPGGGWWYTDDIINYLNSYSISNITLSMNESDLLIDELEKNNIIILCLDMYYISDQVKDEWRINRFYVVDDKEWGHFIVIKGYKKVDNQILYEVYDPYSFGATYNDQTLKGRNRYYKRDEIDDATENWWNFAIIVSKSPVKSTKGVNVHEIEHKYGR